MGGKFHPGNKNLTQIAEFIVIVKISDISSERLIDTDKNYT